ncbi:MAG TPA: NHL repeat-containing protein, partial [bacterium]|nr:NHL repeat-containing protein [bacterium]
MTPAKNKKTSKAFKKKASLPKKSESGSNNKNIARVLVGVVLIFCVIESFNLFQTEPVKVKAQLISKVDGTENPSGPFTAWGIAPIGTDKFVVADNQHDRLIEFDRQGNFLTAWGKHGSEVNNFHEPSGLVSDGKGNVYVADTWNSAIKGFDEKGKMILDFDLTKYPGFFGPRGIGFDGSNFVIADTGSHRVALIGLDGTMGPTWGHLGSNSGEYKNLQDATSDEKGNYFVADTDNDRVQWLNKDGKVIEIIKNLPQAKAVAVDAEGKLYVSSDADGGTVKVYSLSTNSSLFS